jgi:parvulin-like peptidyl-prolyl isomerase
MPSITMHGGVSAERLAQYRPKALEKLVESELLYQEAVRTGLKVEKDRVKDALKDLSGRMGGKKKLEDSLKVRGLTLDQYERMLERFFLIEEIVKREVTEKAAATEEEARAHYEGNRAAYVRPEARRLSHILIAVPANAMPEEREAKKKVALEVHGRAVGGEDFGRLAWDNSDDPYKYKSGDLGYIHKGRLDPALEEAVEKLAVGEMSGVVETIYGFHIVKVTDIRPSGQVEFPDVAQKITRELTEQRADKLREALLSRLKAEAVVEVYQ